MEENMNKFLCPNCGMNFLLERAFCSYQEMSEFGQAFVVCPKCFVVLNETTGKIEARGGRKLFLNSVLIAKDFRLWHELYIFEKEEKKVVGKIFIDDDDY